MNRKDESLKKIKRVLTNMNFIVKFLIFFVKSKARTVIAHFGNKLGWSKF